MISLRVSDKYFIEEEIRDMFIKVAGEKKEYPEGLTVKELIEKEEVTIVMTTHDMGLLDIADCIYHLEDGEIVDEK